ncbi:MAG: hypothetical protein Q7R58_01970 [bacterium]|nr:hypothetical protein [bacterium]
MRFFVITAFILFSLAPSALAVVEDDRFGGGQSGGGGAGTGGSRDITPVPTGGTPSGSAGSPSTGWIQPTPTGGIQTNPGSNSLQTNPGSTGNTRLDITLINPLNSGNCTPNGNCLETFLLNILEFVIRIGTIIVILMMVYVGFLFVAARGEPAKLTTARSALLWTVVGALILLGSQAIALGIKATVQALSVGG